MWAEKKWVWRPWILNGVWRHKYYFCENGGGEQKKKHKKNVKNKIKYSIWIWNELKTAYNRMEE